MRHIFDTKLFTILQYHLPSTEFKVFDDYKFFEQPELTKKVLMQPRCKCIVHCRYSGPFKSEYIDFINWLIQYYPTADQGQELIFIHCDDYPELSNVKNIHLIPYPEYYAFYYPLYSDFKLTSGTIDKKFLCLNKRGNLFRQLLYKGFVNHNIIEHSFFSYLGENVFKVDKQRVADGVMFDEDLYNEIESTIESEVSLLWPEVMHWVEPPKKFIEIDNDISLSHYKKWTSKNGWNTLQQDPSWHINEHLYNSSFCSVVVETSPESPKVNLSEKTIRAIAHGHPMIVIGAQNTVSRLRDLGFDMFDDIIDHCYDSMESPIKRLKYSFESIKKINAIPIHKLTRMNKMLYQRKQNNITQLQNLWLKMNENEKRIVSQLEMITNLKINIDLYH